MALTIETVRRHPLGDIYLFRTPTGLPLEAYFSGDYTQKGDALRAQRYGAPGRIPREQKAIVKLSVMGGCPFRCAPCDAGLAGYLGNATAEEMVAQFDAIVEDQQLSRCDKLKLHVSKLGEPALNGRATMGALQRIVAAHPAFTMVPTVSTLPRSAAKLTALARNLFRWEHPLKELKINVGASSEALRLSLLGPVLPMSEVGALLVEELNGAVSYQRITLTALALPNVPLDLAFFLDTIPAVWRPRVSIEVYKVNQTQNARAHHLGPGLRTYAQSAAYDQALDVLRNAGLFVYLSPPSDGEQLALIANGFSLLAEKETSSRK